MSKDDADTTIKSLQKDRAAFGAAPGSFDDHIYGKSKAEVTELPTEEEEAAALQGDDDNGSSSSGGGFRRGGSHPSTMVPDAERESGDPFDDQTREMKGSGLVNTRVSDREDSYKQQRMNRMISPERGDAFSGNKAGANSYKDIMMAQRLQQERKDVEQQIQKKVEEATEARKRRPGFGDSQDTKKSKPEDATTSGSSSSSSSASGRSYVVSSGRFEVTPGRFEVTPGRFETTPGRFEATPGRFEATPGRFEATPGRFEATPGRFEATPGRFEATPGRFETTPGRFEATPGRFDATPGRFDATPGRFDTTPGRFDTTPGAAAGAASGGRSRWDETPQREGSAAAPRSRWDETPQRVTGDAGAKKGRSRWDETPVAGASGSSAIGATPVGGAGVGATPQGTPMGMMGATPAASGVAMTPEMANQMRWQGEMDARNRPLTDEDLDAMFPKEGYKILDPPPGYEPVMTPSRRLLATPTPMAGTPGFAMGATPGRDSYGVPLNNVGPDGGALPFIKEEDYQYFSALLEEVNEDEITPEEAKERKIMKLLLKIKNGTPAQRKAALRQITDKARLFGAGPLFNQILPLLMAPTIEDQERHLLVKVIDRVLYKLDDLVRPYVHKILVVIEPLLIDEDYYARVEGREIISNLAKAAGLAAMIATMRPDIDNVDEYVRNTTARAFAVVASALGIPELLPFLKAVTQSRVSWQARHTGIKIVQQIAILMGCAILPHLKHLVDIVAHGLTDEQQKVRTITALALAAMAEAAHPYGIESFDSVLRPLWKGIRQHRGKGLAAFLKAIGFIIPLMDSVYASHYTKEVMLILIREFASPDEEMKKIVLKVVKQCVGTDGVEAQYVIDEVLPEFFRQFWVRRNALDRRNYRQLVETTVELANKVGFVPIVGRIVDDLKDESEPYRRMVMETIEKVCQNLGAGDVDPRLEEQLMDGLLTAFQEQTADDSSVMLNGFGTVVNALGKRCKPYCNQITATIKWRLHNKEANVRMQAADLISRVVVVMMSCGEGNHVDHLGQVLYEYLNEEYPEVLGSILGALKAIVNVVGMNSMHPPIKELLPRLTPILKNRHEKVQENCIDLIGRIADRGAEHVSPREWMRLCFELLELLKAHKKAIRRATVNTFGYIAKAIGPQDVLHTLLNNLKVQERQNRVCTTVAIAIVAETCSPFTVLPALINEYRVPELNVQNGVLKALSFMFEYIGEMAKDYLNAVAPLLEDALMDRDLVHRQTACTTVKHLALGVAGLNCEPALVHLLNFVWPNIFEKSPHVIRAVFEAVEAFRVSLGCPTIMLYALQGLFHPARRVREVYWKIYNNMYMYAADALTCCYPRLEDEGSNSFRRTYLELFL